MKYQGEQSERKRLVFNYKNRIDRLFALLEETVGQNELIWAGKTMYQVQLLEYYRSIGEHYAALHLDNAMDPNDLIPGYETTDSTSASSTAGETETKAGIVESKQCELNMTMRVGWDSNKYGLFDIESRAGGSGRSWRSTWPSTGSTRCGRIRRTSACSWRECRRKSVPASRNPSQWQWNGCDPSSSIII